jgi:hypothetical protein
MLHGSGAFTGHVLKGERLARGETASKTDVTILPLGIGGSLVLDTVATALCQLVTTYGHVTRQTLFWEPYLTGLCERCNGWTPRRCRRTAP